jgi:hypothetical protein
MCDGAVHTVDYPIQRRPRVKAIAYDVDCRSLLAGGKPFAGFGETLAAPCGSQHSGRIYVNSGMRSRRSDDKPYQSSADDLVGRMRRLFSTICFDPESSDIPELRSPYPRVTTPPSRVRAPQPGQRGGRTARAAL